MRNVLLKKIPVIPKPLKSDKFSDALTANTWVTVDSFLEACRVYKKDPNDYAEHIEWIRSNQRDFFYREWLPFPREILDEWLMELKHVISDINSCKTEKYMVKYYKNTSSCVNFGTCQYFDVCIAPDQEAVIEASYVKRENKMDELDK